jgi:predicted SPOUT superfamily RNA methylase MTH1
MALLGRRLAVSLPDTVLEEKDSAREKTAKLGVIARACAIYGVDVIEVFRDPQGRSELPLIHKVLEYLETPQYLRRRLYPLDEALRYAGALPPLRIPSHKSKVKLEEVTIGEVRDGVTNSDGTVDVGLEVPPRLGQKAPGGRRVTIRIAALKPLTAEVIPKEEAGGYWGYAVESKSVAEVFSDRRFAMKIATSKFGVPLGDCIAALKARFRAAGGVKLVFGSPSRGLNDIAGAEQMEKADFVVNLFAEQHVQTVRTEEAVYAGLGLVNLLAVEKA